MNIIDILNTQISTYDNIRCVDNKIMTVADFFLKMSFKYKNIIEKIREEKDIEKQKQKKQQLPCCIVAGICGETKSEKDMVSKNNLIIIDIDEKENPFFASEQVLLQRGYHLSRLPYVAFVGRSCRGKGLFCLIPVADINKIKKYIESISIIFKDELGLIIDKQCTNVNRLRFISYDEHIFNKEWIKEEVEVFDKIISKQPEFSVVQIKNNENISETGLVSNDVFILKCIMKLVHDKKYKTTSYNEWLLNGFRLATLKKNMGFFLFLLISRNSPSYKNDDDVIKQFNICRKNTKFNRASIAFYFSIAKKEYGSKWIDIINSFELKDYIP